LYTVGTDFWQHTTGSGQGIGWCLWLGVRGVRGVCGFVFFYSVY